MADMIYEILGNLQMLDQARIQPLKHRYYPQRRPEDGYLDWNLDSKSLIRFCNALTKPYPGVRTTTQLKSEPIELIIWEIQPFDDFISDKVGKITNTFCSGEFLVSCSDGRVLVKSWESKANDWYPEIGTIFVSRIFSEQIDKIISRHKEKYPNQKLAERVILRSNLTNKKA